ncbi:MAG: topology modulation protein [Pseudomonadota bacterium]
MTTPVLKGRRRILILGSGGSGKSTLARALGDRLALPVIHLDIHFWSSGWQPTPDAEWQARVRRLVAGEAWVMDGSFSGTLAIRIPRCDAIVFLDLPRLVCVRSVLSRWWRYRFRSRPDLPEGCPETLDLHFLRWVWSYPSRSRPLVLEAIQAAGPGVEVVHLTHRQLARELVEGLPTRDER